MLKLILQPMYVISLVLTLTFLALPVLATPFLRNQSKEALASKVKTSVMLAFFTSLVPLIMFIWLGSETLIANLSWANNLTYDINISFKFDFYSIMFTPVALYVTWAILEFAAWYMESDPNLNKFFKYLLLFLISMIILVTANNLFQIFIGWEGVGILSFLLIGWWHGRANANTAALQAMAYNRIGDVGFLFSLAWLTTKTGSWELEQIFSTQQNLDFTPALNGFILAAAGKSAQFGLHPWLPSAMEGPTPVSALLHSSTMVVAGIFLLIRMNPIMHNNPAALHFCLCLGAITSFYTALCAMNQNDLKKIIAFSTSSQLGLMMVTIGLNQPHLAFFHICTHAFFKAMLFLCSGIIIHSLNGEQDIRKMGGLHHLAPVTASCITIGSLALAGTPFLSGFFSKDAIIEAVGTSTLNFSAMALVLYATMATAVYSFRIVYFVMMGHPRFPSMTPISENNPNILNPLKRLAIGSIVAGLLIVMNINMPASPTLTMPFFTKCTALFLSATGLIAALMLAHRMNNWELPESQRTVYTFSVMLGFFSSTAHKLIPKNIMLLGQKIAAFNLEQWLEKSAPKSIKKVVAFIHTFKENGELEYLKMTPQMLLKRFLMLVLIAIILYFFVP